jgi:ABC-2 type transport system permease protein
MDGIRYMDFIVPGLVMMSVIQNSYGNILLEFFGAKFGRHVEELLVSPMPTWVILGGYVTGAGAARVDGRRDRAGDLDAVHPREHAASLHHLRHGAAGRDHLLARRLRQRGVREEVRRHRDRADLHPHAADLPGRRVLFGEAAAGWAEAATHLNPVFYMVNAFRFGLLGISDVSMWTAFVLMLAFIVG